MTDSAADTALHRALGIINEGMEAGLHLGAQLYVSLEGKPVVDTAVGLGRPDAPMTTETLMIWFSSTKAVTSVAAGQLWEAGAFDLDDRVIDHIPEWAGGKDDVRIRHLFTHTAGFRQPGGPAAMFRPWDEFTDLCCKEPLEEGWVPGKRAGYHAGSGMHILGEIVRRHSGLPFADYVRERVFGPLGMNNCWIGMPPDRHAAYGELIGVMHETSGATPRPMLPLASADGCALSIPGGGGRGPMRELGRFYEMLLNRGELDGGRILNNVTVEAMSAKHRTDMHDETFGIVVNWGLGFIVDAFLYGRHSSPRAFGHGGARSSVAFCDPEYGLAVALVVNGMPDHLAHHRRQDGITTAIYEDLGLVPAGSEGRVRPYPAVGLV